MSHLNPYLKHKRKAVHSTSYYVDGILNGDRYILGESITLIESTDPQKRKLAVDVLKILSNNPSPNTQRIAITGSPGVGKSTFIETLGKTWIEEGEKVAVLAIDPSSSLSSGSILGDKTRMEDLSQEANAFIRPSPAGKTLGGIAKNTKEAIHLCESAGFNKIIVETVGVGQSETLVSGMVDFFVLLILPGSGDEVQGIKRGIMELADVLIINKADGDREKLAKSSAIDYRNALKLLNVRHPNWKTKVLTTSGLEGTNIQDVRMVLDSFYMDRSQYIQSLRSQQDKEWFLQQSEQSAIQALLYSGIFSTSIHQLADDILNRKLDPYSALASISKEIIAKTT